MVNAKAKGARAERRCVKDLEAQGYWCTRAGGSLGVFDVIAYNPFIGVVRLIQVKSGTGKLRPAERRALEDLGARADNILVQYWHWNRGWEKKLTWLGTTWTTSSLD
jgi:Holliday junction resolvase